MPPAIQDLKFVTPEHVRELRDRVLAFVEEEVYPVEDKLKELGLAGGMGVGDLKNQDNVAVKEIKRLQDLAKKKGLWALGHPKEIGGQGLPFRDYIYVNEVQGRSELGQVALGTHSLQDSLMLHHFASAEIKERYLDDLVQARIYPSFAMTEPDVASSDPTGIQTKAELVDGGRTWLINGRKWWTSNAASAKYTCVMVRTEPSSTAAHGAFSIILVPTDTPGYNIVRSTHVLGTHGGDHSEVKYENVRVPYSNLIGERGQGFLIAQRRLGPGRIFHCMRWVGQMQRAFDLMCERLVTRKLKGALLGDTQLMQQFVFESFADIQAHRLLTLAAAEKMDAGSDARVELAIAKGWGAQALGRVLDRAVQVYGAKGLTEDTPLSDMYRLGRAARFYDGPDQVHMVSSGAQVLSLYKNGKRWDFSNGGPARRPKM